MYDDEPEFGGFTVKYRATNPNLTTFNEFKEYALKYTDDNYIVAIRELLEKAKILENIYDGFERKSGKQNKEMF